MDSRPCIPPPLPAGVLAGQPPRNLPMSLSLPHPDQHKLRLKLGCSPAAQTQFPRPSPMGRGLQVSRPRRGADPDPWSRTPPRMGASRLGDVASVPREVFSLENPWRLLGIGEVLLTKAEMKFLVQFILMISASQLPDGTRP